jgi:glucuronate isomerase
MKSFLNDNFLLETVTAQKLYHDYAKAMPIIDYHNHLPPAAIAGDKKFTNLTDIWLKGDHYKWRAMRTYGVNEKYITGDANDEEKFLKWAEVVPYTVRHPLFHWTHMELKNPFGITEVLNPSSAKKIYTKASEQLQQPSFSAKKLLQYFNVQMAGTTDDPCDDLVYHQQLQQEKFSIKVLPSFRPDKALQISNVNEYRQYINRLSAASGIKINNIDTLLEALKNRIDYFAASGAIICDHGLQKIPGLFELPAAAAKEYAKLLAGENIDTSLWLEAFQGFILVELCKMYQAKNWVQQFHIGAIRNNNSRLFQLLGADSGFDSMGDDQQALNLSKFLNRLDHTNQLAKTIIYNINPALNEVFATMIGNFNDGSIKGKVQFGSGWWFLDQKDGIEKQLNAISNMSLLSCFIGMLTDSRSFLSYSRHEYFRRILCNIFGKDMEQGELPNDLQWMGKIIQDICYNNAKEYFNL